MKVKKGVFSWCFYIFLHLFYSFTSKMSISLFFLIVVRWFFFIYFYQEWTTSFCLKCFGIVILVHYSHFSIKMCLVHLNIHIKSAFHAKHFRFINMYCKCCVYGITKCLPSTISLWSIFVLFCWNLLLIIIMSKFIQLLLVLYL